MAGFMGYIGFGTETVLHVLPMLKLTKKADYGLIALKHLAVRKPLSASAKDIADNYGIPLPLLSKILPKLAKNGFLASEHGANGGYRLARDPRTITAFDVIRAIEGPFFLTSCFTEHGDCEHSTRCNVREPLRKVHEGIVRLLSGITIAGMAADSADPEPEPEPKQPSFPPPAASSEFTVLTNF